MTRPVERVPHALILFRLIAGPLMVVLVLGEASWAAWACVGLLVSGVLSDIFDGVIARRLGVATVQLRKLDSRCDVVFWVSATLAVHLLHPALIGRTWPMILTLVALEASAHAISFARFGKEASPHHLASKLFGLVLLALLIQLFLTGETGTLYVIGFAWGVLSQLESIAITLALPGWRCDVGGLGAAMALRRARDGAVS